jgi:molecular chaperone DnaJ
VTPRPRRSSRRSARRTRCSPTPRSARSTTRSARWAPAHGSRRPAAPEQGASRTSSAPCSAARYTYQQGEYDDLLGGLFGGGRFGQPTGGYRGFGGPSKGRDVTASTTLDFITATKGDRITLQTADGREISVNVPAGVADGQKIRLRGKGHPSPDGGEPGDIVLTVKVRKHPVFERDGLHLRVNVPVTFAEAALGATIQVPTLGGDPVKLRVAPGTPSGRVLRVKGRGVHSSKGTGDLLAVVQVAVPSHLSKEAEDKLREFAAQLPDEDPREDLIAKGRSA